MGVGVSKAAVERLGCRCCSTSLSCVNGAFDLWVQVPQTFRRPRLLALCLQPLHKIPLCRQIFHAFEEGGQQNKAKRGGARAWQEWRAWEPFVTSQEAAAGTGSEVGLSSCDGRRFLFVDRCVAALMKGRSRLRSSHAGS